MAKMFSGKCKGRRASLEISINAIVILVMAMVVLGLGLSFVRNLFGKGTDNLGKVLDNSELENPADSETPLTIDRTTTVRATKSTTLSVGFYNSHGSDVTAMPAGSSSNTRLIACADQDGSASVFRLTSPSAVVAASEAKGFSVSLKPIHKGGLDSCDTSLNAGTAVDLSTCPAQATKAAAGTYICTLDVTTNIADFSQSGQFIVVVTG